MAVAGKREAEIGADSVVCGTEDRIGFSPFGRRIGCPAGGDMVARGTRSLIIGDPAVGSDSIYVGSVPFAVATVPAVEVGIIHRECTVIHIELSRTQMT